MGLAGTRLVFVLYRGFGRDDVLHGHQAPSDQGSPHGCLDGVRERDRRTPCRRMARRVSRRRPPDRAHLPRADGPRGESGALSTHRGRGAAHDERQPNFDIYLPVWLARWNKTIFGAILIGGLLLTLALWLQQSGSR